MLPANAGELGVANKNTGKETKLVQRTAFRKICMAIKL
jgi:hypothetical protein